MSKDYRLLTFDIVTGYDPHWEGNGGWCDGGIPGFLTPPEPKNVNQPTILVLATLDTKGPEAEFLRQRIKSRGERAIVIDSGVIGKPQAKADITRRQVAAQAENR